MRPHGADESAKKPVDRLVVKTGGRVFFVKCDDIDWIEAAGNYVRLHVRSVTHVLRETMSTLEGRLDPDRFFRIHRSHIVNIDSVQDLQPWAHGEYVVRLTSGVELTMTRSYRARLREKLGVAF